MNTYVWLISPAPSFVRQPHRVDVVLIPLLVIPVKLRKPVSTRVLFAVFFPQQCQSHPIQAHGARAKTSPFPALRTQ